MRTSRPCWTACREEGQHSGLSLKLRPPGVAQAALSISTSRNRLQCIEVYDDYRFAFVLNSPNVSFLNVLSDVSFAIYPAEAAQMAGWGTEVIIGTGPFKLKEFRPHERLVLERFDGYHGGAKKLQEMVFIHMDENTALLEFEAGNIDVTDVSDPRLIAWYLNDPEYGDNVYRVEQNAVIALSFNMQMEPFSNREVRRAISMAINRAEIAGKLMQGLYTPAKSYLPKGVIGYDENLEPFEYNPQKSKEILAAAGYPNGIELTAITTDTAATTVVLQYLEQSFKEANITLNIQTVDAAGFNDIRAQGKVPMFILTWAGESGDPDAILNLWSTPMSQFISNFYNNSEFDAQLALGLQEQDPVKREELYKTLDYQLAREDIVGAPIMHPNAFLLISDRVDNLVLGNGNRYYDVELKW